MAFTGQENHAVSKADAAKFTANYRRTAGGARRGGFFGRDALLQILNQKDCVGMRYYFAKDDNNLPIIVLTGVTADQNDIENGVLLEVCRPCPPFCGAASELNPTT